MEEMAISKFKSECLAVVERVRRTRKPIRITKRGKPVAEVQPVVDEKRKGGLPFGCMKGTGRILGDIVSPSSEPEDWDELR